MDDHFTMTMRLPDRFDGAVVSDYLALIARRPGACDEVWFSSPYGLPSLADHAERATQMADAAARVRALGVSASLQVSNTIGHGDYHRDLDFSGLTWQRMVGPDGTVAPYCSCPRDQDFHAYLEAFTRAYCSWGPDRLWIDDDLRMNAHAPVSYGCFCDRCLEEFSRAVGRAWTREALSIALNAGNDLATRARWVQFGRDSLGLVAGVVGRAAVSVAPNCILGLQHADSAWGGYNGPDWSHAFAALREASGKGVGSRPGGGLYTDFRPREVIDKAIATGLQNARLPAMVDFTTYECENLPGTLVGKSAHGTAVECTLAISQGCNSLSFTDLMFPHEPEWHETMMTQLEAWRPFWARYVGANRGTRNTGVEVAFSRNHATRALSPAEQPFAWASTWFGGVSPAAVLGLPLCWDSRAPVALLCAPAARGVDEWELRQLAVRGLLIECEALEVLEERGLAQCLGLRSLPMKRRFGNLALTDDELNGKYAGQALYWGSLAFGAPRAFEVTAGNVRCLSRYANTNGEIGDMESAAIENADGGRVVVFGWGLSSPTATTSRRHQILAAANWAARGRLPALLETPSQVVVVPRCDERGRVKTVLLLNVSLDPTPALTLRLHSPDEAGTWTWLRPLERDLPVPAGDTFNLPQLAPWHVGVLVRDGRA